MTQKTENWKEALLRVREGLKEANEPVVEKTEDELINEEIDALLNEMEEVNEKFRQSVPSDKNLVDFEVFLDKGDAEKSVKAVETLCKKNGWKHQKTVDAKSFTTKDSIDVYSHWLTWEDDPKDERAIRLTVVANEKSKNYKDVDLSPAFKTTQLLNSASFKSMYAEKTEEGHSVDKLTEKNMLGRLAKSMMLNEENKQKLFDYFESGELEQ